MNKRFKILPRKTMIGTRPSHKKKSRLGIYPSSPTLSTIRATITTQSHLTVLILPSMRPNIMFTVSMVT